MSGKDGGDKWGPLAVSLRGAFSALLRGGAAEAPLEDEAKMVVQRRGNVVYAVSERTAVRTGTGGGCRGDYLSENVRYTRLNPDQDEGFADIQKLAKTVKSYRRFGNDDDFSEEQFVEPPLRVPWKAIGLATLLFVLGSLLILIGGLLLGGVIDSKYSDRTWPVLILGSILWVPGFYHVRIAYYASQGQTGFSFEDIPDFD